MHLNARQRRILEEARSKPFIVVSGRYKRAVEKLEEAGLVKATYEQVSNRMTGLPLWQIRVESLPY